MNRSVPSAFHAATYAFERHSCHRLAWPKAAVHVRSKETMPAPREGASGHRRSPAIRAFETMQRHQHGARFHGQTPVTRTTSAVLVASGAAALAAQTNNPVRKEQTQARAFGRAVCGRCIVDIMLLQQCLQSRRLRTHDCASKQRSRALPAVALSLREPPAAPAAPHRRPSHKS